MFKIIFSCLCIFGFSQWALAATTSAMGQLQTSTDGQFATVADGGAKRDDGGVEVGGEQKGLVISVDQFPADVGYDDEPASEWRLRRYHQTVPSRTVTTMVDRQRLHITDRKKFTSRAERAGQLLGGSLGGLAGLVSIPLFDSFALTALSVGGLTAAGFVVSWIGIGVVGAALGAMIGGYVARTQAENTPDDFTRDSNERRVENPPSMP